MLLPIRRGFGAAGFVAASPGGRRRLTAVVACGGVVASPLPASARWSLPVAVPLRGGVVPAAVGWRRQASTPVARRPRVAPAGLFARELDERQHVGVDHAQRRLRAELAAQQPHRLEIRVHVLGAAGEEAGDQHALERRDVHLRLDGRLDRDLVEVRARAQRERKREAS